MGEPHTYVLVMFPLSSSFLLGQGEIGGEKSSYDFQIDLVTGSRKGLMQLCFMFFNCFFLPFSPTNLFKNAILRLCSNLYHSVMTQKLLGLCLSPI